MELGTPKQAKRTFLNFRVWPIPSATLTGTTAIFKGDSTRLGVALTGTAPWQFALASGTSSLSVLLATQSPFVLTVRPDTTTNYRLISVTICAVPALLAVRPS